MTFETPSIRTIETAMHRAHEERSKALVAIGQSLRAWVLSTKEALIGGQSTAHGSC